MKLKKYTDYALRVLIYTASKEDNQLASITEVSETFSISKEHIRKIVHQLTKLGLLETIRGRGGGIKLAKPPEDINIGRIVRILEQDFVLLECFDKDMNECVITPSCKLKHALNKALAAFFSVLDEYTLDQLVANKDELRLLMDLK
ncbi:RrF2 family transcriptional regulator [Radiobacillus deserti]|uniref:HTH-type transcriptional regulator NsrR n=1 Tax=Radiobacillus deserti TaxID=2594883 RepID=A0A516KBM0_9BACI|nr:Rrf2 family transcriptional regulator [Radiobacillus deserti]QDP38791.1 Rrf2 family transcriptional regulator [Radiobacillus deserti]